jgi:hypothetical protein
MNAITSTCVCGHHNVWHRWNDDTETDEICDHDACDCSEFVTPREAGRTAQPVTRSLSGGTTSPTGVLADIQEPVSRSLPLLWGDVRSCTTCGTYRSCYVEECVVCARYDEQQRVIEHLLKAMEHRAAIVDRAMFPGFAELVS